MSPSDVDERWAGDVVLGNGETVHVRPIRPSDARPLAEFHRRQSPESIYRRYFTPKPELSPPSLEHFTNVDFVDRVALVVERRGEFIGWASYERWTGRDDADAAFMVDDRHHGKGIATLLLEHLASIARSNGIRRFTAEVLAENQPMLAVFSRAGWPVQRRFDSGVIDLDFELTETHEFLDSVERREQRADSRAVARILMPRTIAVVGASDRPDTIGAALWRHVSAGATGSVYAVNPNRPTVGGRPTWPTVQAIPDDVWLAVVAVPASALPAVIEDCIASRVRGAVVVTSVDGTDLDLHALVARARSYGMRIIGPGSMGIAASRPEIGLQASLVPVDLPAGAVAISMQSGTLGASLLGHAGRLQLGLSWFVSLGDKSDISGNDLLQFWEDDETTKVIAMYTESFGNPRKFARIARRVSRQRPVVAVRTGAAAVEPSGSALYHQAGLIEVPTVTALLDTVRVLATQPVLEGPNVAVLANSRSPATLARAALANAGLVPVDGPVALDWRSTPADYGHAIRAALSDPAIDGALVLHAPPLAESVAAPVDELDAAAATADKPVVAVMLGGGDGPLHPGSEVPSFSFPEAAAATLGRSYAYARWRRTEGAVEPADVTTIDRAGAAKIIAAAIARDASTLDLDDAANLLAAYGIAAPATTAACGRGRRRRGPEVGLPRRGEGAAPPGRAVRGGGYRARPRRRRRRRRGDRRDADDAGCGRRARRRPGDGAARTRPARAQHGLTTRPAGRGRARGQPSRPHHRRSVASGSPVVRRGRGADRRITGRPGDAPGRPRRHTCRRPPRPRRPTRPRPPRDRTGGPQPGDPLRRAGLGHRRRHRRPPRRPRRTPDTAAGLRF